MTLLADVAGIVSRSHDLDETLGNVVDLVAKRLDADVCSVYLTETSLRHLTLRATIGLAKHSIGEVRLSMGEGLVGMVAETGEPIAAEDARAHPRYLYFPETGEEQYASFLAAPLVVNRLVIGVIAVQTQRARRFEDSDVELLQTCARMLAPVVMNAQLLALVAFSDEERSRVVDELRRSGAAVGQGRSRRRRNHVQGIASSRGIAIGPIYFLEDPLDLEHVEYEPNADPAEERADLEGALGDARRELHDVRDEAEQRFGPEFAAIFNTHIQILEDTGFVNKLEGAVAEHQNGLLAPTSGC